MTKEDVKEKLIEAGKRDQDIRLALSEKGVSKELLMKMDDIDAENNKLIKDVISEYGLVTISGFGKDAYKAAFLLVQHMTKEDVSIMEDYLEKMKQCVNDISMEHLALLQDRVLVYTGKMQLYGTQFYVNNETGEHTLLEVQDPENLNIRRQDLGLSTIEEYLHTE